MINLNKEMKYLLALSGGPDSMALFYLLLEGGYQFHVAHVDHGWRKESGDEAKQLGQMCEQHVIPFYLQKLSGIEQKEDVCRQKRLEFFKELYHSVGFDALLMAHHADDQVETILKRVFEGSSLSHISGMKGEAQLFGMRVIRPLLSLFKSEILSYLDERSSFDDATNLDPRFLRGRMRGEMIPYLEKVFGKGIKENVLLLGKRIEGCVKPTLVERGPFGYCLERDEGALREALSREGVSLPRGEVNKALRGERVVYRKWDIVTEGDHLFMVQMPAQSVFSLEPLLEERPIDDWRGVWQGKGALFINKGELGAPKLGAKLLNGIELREWYRIHKVPKFLRMWVPVVWDEGKIVGECLTGKGLDPRNQHRANHLLTLK